MDQELLQQEINTYREKVKRCGSKEEVWQIKEDYEDVLLLGISVVESNPVLSLEQKLEFTMIKDTKLSMMENAGVCRSAGEGGGSGGYRDAGCGGAGGVPGGGIEAKGDQAGQGHEQLCGHPEGNE